jgi:hypothetical protein
VAIARRSILIGKESMPQQAVSPSILDEADVAASFDAGQSNFRKVINVGVEAHIFSQIVH